MAANSRTRAAVKRLVSVCFQASLLKQGRQVSSRVADDMDEYRAFGFLINHPILPDEFLANVSASEVCQFVRDSAGFVVLGKCREFVTHGRQKLLDCLLTKFPFDIGTRLLQILSCTSEDFNFHCRFSQGGQRCRLRSGSHRGQFPFDPAREVSKKQRFVRSAGRSQSPSQQAWVRHSG